MRTKRKLTRKRALQICRDLWLWVAKTDSTVKGAWPKWECNGGNIPTMLSDCPCCEYSGMGEDKIQYCKPCPLKSLWGNAPFACMKYNSPFEEWRMGKSSTKNARKIANACTKELRRIKS